MLVLLAAAAAMSNIGAPREAEGVVYFPPEYFAQYAPRTAREMVARVPGFAIDEGDQNVRGFSGAAGNVLIDGARPTVKSQSIYDLLDRIPAAQVVRLELRRGGVGAEAAGQGTIVNVVRSAAGGSGVYEAEVELNDEGRASPRGEASYSGRVGQLEYSVGASRYLENLSLDGERKFTDGAGVFTNRRRDDSPRTYREVGVDASVSAPVFGGLARANLEAGRWTFQADLTTRNFDVADLFTDVTQFDIEDRQRRNEIGLDYERGLGPTTLTLRALQARRWFAGDEASNDRNAAGVQTANRLQSRRSAAIERIARGQLDIPLAKAHALSLSVEGAQNVLESRLRVRENGVAQPVPPNADTVIEEVRLDGAATHDWTLSPKWRVQTILAGENSTLTQEGAAGSRERTFAFFKPSVELSRSLEGGSQLRLAVSRKVGQLNFDDFAATASSVDARSSAGNDALRPETSWRVEGTWDGRFESLGAVSVSVYREWFEDVNDRVLVQGFDAPGNIGEGEVLGLNVDATIKLDALAKGLEFVANGYVQQAEVTDPITGRTRSASDFREFQYDLELRQSLRGGALLWSVELFGFDDATFFRAAEIDSPGEDPNLQVSVEHAIPFGAKLAIFGSNLLDRELYRDRRFFAPDRSGATTRVESRSRTWGRFYGVRLSGRF